MGSNAMLDRLDADIEELEQEMFPDQVKPKEEVEPDIEVKEEEVEPDPEDDDPEVQPEPDVEVESEPEDDTEPEPEVDEPEEDPEEEKPKKRKSWKAEHEKLDRRFRNLKTSYDGKLFDLRNQVATLLTTNQSLEERISGLLKQVSAATANKDIYEGVFTEEDVDVLGEDAINLIKKANARAIEAATAPLKEQVDAARTQAISVKKNEADLQRKEAYNGFLNGLKSLVPDFDTLNVDEGFKKYMDGVEPGASKARKDELGDAAKLGNARWAASFFDNYRALRAAPQQKLEEMVTPKRNNASTVETKDTRKKVYSIDQFNNFYDKLTRGGFNHSKEEREKGERIRRMYDKAYAEGRIR
jgi:hypothetical protein